MSTNKMAWCRLNVTLLLIEDRVDRPLLHLCLFAMSPGLIWQQIKADIRVCAVLTAGEEVPGEHSKGL